jgi:hypothetical protein
MPGDPSAPRGLAPDCMIETAEGPVAMKETPHKGFAVLTRLPSGELGFRQLIKVVASGPVARVRIVLETGHEVVAARAHPFFRQGMEAVPAAQLVPGDRLECAFHYPAGYVPHDRAARAPFFDTAIAVRALEPAADGEVLTGTVRDAHRLFLTAGILCGE